MPTHDSDLAQLRQRHGARYRWWLLGSVMIGTMASVMSSTIINVAVPEMSAHFAIGQDSAQWVGSGFMLAMTVSMLTTPWLLARLGLRHLVLGALALLLGGGLVGGAAGDFSAVLLGRVAQGLAAGVLQPLPAIVIMQVFASGEQGRATGLFGMGVVLASAMGPTVGGVLVHAFGWRSIFYMVLPFCAVAMVMIHRFAPTRVRAPATASFRLDLWGLLLVGTATVALLNGFVQWHQHARGTAWLLWLLSALAAPAFVLWQRQLGRRPRPGQAHPLVPLDLFQHGRFALGCVVALLYGVVLFGSTYLLPVFLQLGLGLSPALTGWLMLPSGVALALTMGVVGRWLDHAPHQPVAAAGFILLGVSLLLMLPLHLEVHWLWIVAVLLLGRIGLGGILPGMHFNTLRGLPRQWLTQGASVSNYMRVLGGALGVNLCGLLLDWRLDVHGASLAGTAEGPRLLAFHDSFLVFAGVSLAASVAAWGLRAPRSPARSDCSQ